MDEPSEDYAKSNKPVTNKILYDSTYMRYLVKMIESRMVISGSNREAGNGSYCLMGIEKSSGDGWW